MMDTFQVRPMQLQFLPVLTIVVNGLCLHTYARVSVHAVNDHLVAGRYRRHMSDWAGSCGLNGPGKLCTGKPLCHTCWDWLASYRIPPHTILQRTHVQLWKTCITKDEGMDYAINIVICRGWIWFSWTLVSYYWTWPPTYYHYIDVIMTTMAHQITSLTVVYSIVYSDADQRKHQSSASLAFVWGIHRDRWISRPKGQLRWKCFHLMTSSWIKHTVHPNDSWFDRV